MPDVGEFLKLKDAERLVNLSPPAFRERIKRGEIQTFASPIDRRAKLVRVSDLHRLMVPRPITGEVGTAPLGESAA